MKEKRKNLFCPTGHQGGFLLTPFFVETLLIGHFGDTWYICDEQQTLANSNQGQFWHQNIFLLWMSCLSERLEQVERIWMGGIIAFYRSKEIDPLSQASVHVYCTHPARNILVVRTQMSRPVCLMFDWPKTLRVFSRLPKQCIAMVMQTMCVHSK